MEEGGVEHGDVRKVGKRLAGHLDTQQCGRIVQRRKWRQLADLGDQCVVDDRRLVQVGPAVHHPVADRDHPGHVVGQLAEHHLQRRGVVGDLCCFSSSRAGTLTDPLDDPVCHHRTRIRVDDSVFHR